MNRKQMAYRPSDPEPWPTVLVEGFWFVVCILLFVAITAVAK